MKAIILIMKVNGIIIDFILTLGNCILYKVQIFDENVHNRCSHCNQEKC